MMEPAFGRLVEVLLVQFLTPSASAAAFGHTAK